MSNLLAGFHVVDVFGLIFFFVLWIVLFQCAHLLVTLFRRDPLIGWAIRPFGVTVVFLREPSTFFLWLDVVVPALVSGGTLYIGLFTPASAIVLPAHILLKVLVIIGGVLITSAGDIKNALRDLRYPLWGEVRILRNIQLLHDSNAKIHFTSFGQNYLLDHFRTSPADLLQAL